MLRAPVGITHGRLPLYARTFHSGALCADLPALLFLLHADRITALRQRPNSHLAVGFGFARGIPSLWDMPDAHHQSDVARPVLDIFSLSYRRVISLRAIFCSGRQPTARIFNTPFFTLCLLYFSPPSITNAVTV
ncbi:hypothetical protein GN958_ATG09739 [Phytophthora infestans]|uniref:Uncharacterized protein n=1 Tax=Phytophthora infestans TaxID=4787 RepID=A0A8S9UJF3_PHYIN|nr:hypothetical protein GN958_ATG09739 [Phytophthora infestans]